jgi:hypothetical protein
MRHQIRTLVGNSEVVVLHIAPIVPVGATLAGSCLGYRGAQGEEER